MRCAGAHVCTHVWGVQRLTGVLCYISSLGCACCRWRVSSLSESCLLCSLPNLPPLFPSSGDLVPESPSALDCLYDSEWNSFTSLGLSFSTCLMELVPYPARSTNSW